MLMSCRFGLTWGRVSALAHFFGRRLFCLEWTNESRFTLNMEGHRCALPVLKGGFLPDEPSKVLGRLGNQISLARVLRQVG